MNKLNLYSSQKQSNSFTILGKILVANTFLLSKLIYSMTLAYVDRNSIKIANSKINRFFNGGTVSSYISHDIKTIHFEAGRGSLIPSCCAWQAAVEQAGLVFIEY